MNPKLGEEKEGGGMSWEIEIGIYTLPCIRQIRMRTYCVAQRLYPGLLGDGNGKEIYPLKEEVICVYV